MNAKSPRTWLYAILVSLAVAEFVSVTNWLPASPSDEISRAVSADGTANIRQANADVFLDAFASIIAAVDQKTSPPYVEAALKLRPDLKDQIADTATEIYAAPEDSESDPDNHVSQHRRRCKICHHGHTLTLPCHAAHNILRHHPEDTRGPCPPTPTPTPHH
jgi:hypothetical protein